MPGKRVTQADIAKKAGVSQAAVSMALSSHETAFVSAETIARVLSVARQLGYQSDVPKTSKRKRTKNIGFLVPEEHDRDILTVSIRRLYAGVQQRLEPQGYDLIQATLRPDEPLPSLVSERKVFGVIIEDDCNVEAILRIRQHVPVVLLNCYHELLDIDSVMPDNANGIWQAVKHLYDYGHRHIGVFGVQATRSHLGERLAAYHKSLALLDLPHDEEYVGVREPQHFGSQEEIEQFAHETLLRWRSLPTPPTGVVALADGYASFLLRAARHLGIDVPRQLSVVGFDNLTICDHTEPRLTSIEQPMEAMGQAACETLLQRIDGVTDMTRKLRMGVTLIERESVAPPFFAG
ncbi:MAG TPA: LacI family DNA-binding transcriptional regulator [Armatimonadota bacterium]|nr:LacI family DNA-binding transcriptional regulator [Armatimonadota bacterium]